MKTAENLILKDFISKQENYKTVESFVTDSLKRIVKDNSFFIMDIQHRVKDVASLEGKLVRKHGKYKSIYDITDLVGFRIICYFEDTVDRIAEALEKEFWIDRDNSIDKRAVLEDTEFGYLSLHYICKIKESSGLNTDVCNIPFEIQIRTVLQHAWAEIEHDLGYKSKFGVPKTIVRDFSRVAGLLEIADNEFRSLRDNSVKYTAQIKEKISNDQAEDVLIDIISLKEYINNSKSFSNFLEKIKKELSIDIEINSFNTGYLMQLQWLGINKIGEFYKLFQYTEDFVIAKLKEIVDSFGIDIIACSAILHLMLEGYLIKENYSDVQIKKYLELDDIDQIQVERNLKRIISYR